VEVLRLVASGLSNSQMASRLFISEATVKTHIHNILTKAGLRDRVQAVSYALRTGIWKPD
jgi:DNA-binding NarL/FixJ family response regulator